jgi:hypothetical protein
LPGDRDADHPGEHRGGQVGGELEQRGGTGLTGADAEVAKTFGQTEGADGASGLTAGEQPARGALVTQGGVTAAGGDELEDEAGERLGQHDRLAAQPQPHLVVVVLDMLEAKAADRGGLCA